MSRSTEDRIAEHLANSVTVACDALPKDQGWYVLSLVVATLADRMREQALRMIAEREQE